MYFGKKGLKILKGFHLIFVTLTIGGTGWLLYIYLNDLYGWSGNAFPSGLEILAFRMFEWVMYFSFGGLLMTGFIYGMFTSWGFFKYLWILVKWVLVTIIFITAITWGFHNINGSAAFADTGLQHLDLSVFERYKRNSTGFISILMFLLLCIVFLSTIRPWGKVPVKGIKRRGWVLTISGLCAFFIFYFLIGTSIGLTKYREMEINQVHLDLLEDGIYHGRFNEAGGPYVVEVSITNHRITGIKSIQARKSHYVRLSEGIFQKVQESQRIDMDGISGATTTSKCYLKAMEKALSQTE